MERLPIATEPEQTLELSDSDSQLLSACWSALRLLRSHVLGDARPFQYLSIRVGREPRITIDARPELVPGTFDVILVAPGARITPRKSDSVLTIDDWFSVDVSQRGRLSERALDLFRIYVPYCLAAVEARRRGRAVSVCHFAQTLDGRIATDSGDSRWIGCPENLVHAHRMRALCDAVMVGAGTLKRDRPRLTVRHVDGADPVRVVVGSAGLELDCLTSSSSAPVLTVGGDACHIVVASRDGHIHGHDLLTALYARGIHSVFVEGGAATTSALLEDDAVDILQLHIEPLLLGPGLSPFRRPAAARIADAITFRSQRFFPVGSGVMFVGLPAAATPTA